MESGTITSWVLKPGQEFSAGDVLCEVETDKATVSYELQEDGVLAKILIEQGQAEIKVGEAVALAVEDMETYEKFLEADKAGLVQVGGGSAAVSGDASAEVAAASEPQAVATAASGTILSPAARFFSESKGLDATGLAGTGRGGTIITKEDVILALKNGSILPTLAKKEIAAPTATAPAEAPAAAAQAPAAAPLPQTPQVAPQEFETSGAAFEDVEASNMRKVISKRLTESKATVPHSYLAMEVELDDLMAMRKDFAKQDVKVSVNDVIIRSAGLALRDCPQVNSQWNGKEVVPSESVDISVAVATPNGLITPIVPDVDKKGLVAITQKVRDLAGRARENKLAPEEFMGGSFTISNLGMFGIDEFSAVINPPQAAILAVGSGVKKVLPATYIEGEEEKPSPRIGMVMTAKLSYDRRVVSEADAAQFMHIFKHYLSSPKVLMM
eukprot:CAMPEP_0117760044 /NCGR_PEP_ID=MMETSP0947-20121206/16364_1 /TAXON_ID=44440 /ORGANISM="Chattonella subsalsa, Strain CCMP2191" /LENGTH=441 /DNA_ID=CAMNT_0005580597 /DNA_START=324 /DNA_END=1649 /DNA_ORIENTATION=+